MGRIALYIVFQFTLKNFHILPFIPVVRVLNIIQGYKSNYQFKGMVLLKIIWGNYREVYLLGGEEVFFIPNRCLIFARSLDALCSRGILFSVHV